MTLNPYEPPIASPLEAPHRKRSAWRAMGLLLLIGPGVIGSWLGLLFAIFAWSFGEWNRYVSLGVIVAIVVVWLMVVRRIRALRNVGAASLIAYAVTSLLLLLVGIGTIVEGADVLHTLFPQSANEYKRGNWILLAVAAFGATCGLIGLSKGLWQKRPMSMIAGASCVLICLAYLIGIIMPLVLTHRLYV